MNTAYTSIYITTQPTLVFIVEKKWSACYKYVELFIVPFEMRFNFLNWIRSHSFREHI